MKTYHYVLLGLIVLFGSYISTAQTQDAKGCKDSPLVSRFPGSIITYCNDKADDAYRFDNIGPNKTPKKIEGELHQLTYNFPGTASKAQVVRNLHTAFKNAGFTFLYDSGDYGDFTVNMGKTYIDVQVSGGGNYKLAIVTETQLSQEVVADAAALSNGLATSGHTIVHGILFDTGKAEIKPESDAALQEVVKLLKQDPKLKVYVVGHTDNVGVLATNIDLSKRRATAVMQMLITKFGIVADRLQAYGDGPYAPLTSNDSEDGRAQNRRVELVKQ